MADRLKPIPFFVLVAAQTNRLFMIRWSKPAKLEEFLEPNEVNWSVPDWMVTQIEERNVTSSFQKNAKDLVRKMNNDRSVVQEAKVQGIFGGSKHYNDILSWDNNETVTQETYDRIYHDLFRALFKPSPNIARLVEEKMVSANLSPGQANTRSRTMERFMALSTKMKW